MAVDGQAGGASLVERVKRILLEPKMEWERIDAEPATVGGIFKGYVLILAAIPALAMLIGALAFGYRGFGFVIRPSFGDAILGAVVQYVVSVVGVFVLALIIDALAPTFAGTRNRVQAVKVAAYSMTAGWVAGIVGIIPSMGLLTLVSVVAALYGIYLLFLGLPRLMKAPSDKGVPYTATVIVAAIVLYLVAGLITASLTPSFGPGRGMSGTEVSGTMSVPGLGTVDVGKLEQATKRLEAASTRMEKGAATAPVEASALQALLPASLGAYQRTDVSSSAASAGGIGGSSAEARYESGGKGFDLRISDIAAASALAAMGSALNVQSNRETESGYERVGTVAGRMTTEKWDRRSGNGSYGVLVADRFMVEASGTAADVGVLKAAVNAVGLSRLETLAG